MGELVHKIVTSDYFTLIVGLSGIVSLFISGSILYKININYKTTKINNKGDRNIISGGNSNVQR